jgi:hypothetical protein
MFERIQQQDNSVIFEKHIQSIQSCAIFIRKQHSEDFIPVAWKKSKVEYIPVAREWLPGLDAASYLYGSVAP